LLINIVIVTPHCLYDDNNFFKQQFQQPRQHLLNWRTIQLLVTMTAAAAAAAAVEVLTRHHRQAAPRGLIGRLRKYYLPPRSMMMNT
jgi:hypothetical protein